jgi:SAM-dependent methyltransferase
MNNSTAQKSYANFGWQRSLSQIQSALRGRQYVDDSMQVLLDWVREAEERMADCLGHSIRGLRILEIGPGQGMERAYYFGRSNEVVALDLDVIPYGFDPKGYWHMWRNNGLGRVAKTIGRSLIIGRANRAAWMKTIGVDRLQPPKFIHGDICSDVPEHSAFNVVMTWSVFEHLPDPRQALENVIAALKPGGIFYISLHLFTSNNGHHDIRAFTGREDELPLWAHLRPEQKHHIDPSSYLNEWRLSQWRSLLAELAPGHREILEKFEHESRYGSQLTGQLAAELRDYTHEELLTVNAVYIWRKPTEPSSADNA